MDTSVKPPQLEPREIQGKGFHERFHIDSRGRRWNFVQKERLDPRFRGDMNGSLQKSVVWICTECDGVEPVKYDALVHDSVIVADPTKQLDKHDCDLERVRQIMES